jgi:hypothetical protein
MMTTTIIIIIIREVQELAPIYRLGLWVVPIYSRGLWVDRSRHALFTGLAGGRTGRGLIIVVQRVELILCILEITLV